MVFRRVAWVPSVQKSAFSPFKGGRTEAPAGHQRVTWKGFWVAENEQLIADIMGAQERLQHLFAYDRSDPLFSSHLTLSQLKILFLLSRHGNVSGGELARQLGVGLAALSGMIDRLVVQDLVVRTEDLRDRRVRRIGLTRTGAKLIGSIITAGAEKQRRLLSRLSAEELRVVNQAMELMVRVASGELAGEVEGASGG
jgi:DNA-binding MarR family transcriptional regulator